MNQTLEKLRKGQHVTIVALGDSNTEQTWHTYGRLNWVGLLQEALFERYGRNTVTMINSGCCGDTAEGALNRLDRDVLRFEPDLVIIAFGMNDSTSSLDGLAIFQQAMRSLIDRCQVKGNTEVLLRTPNPVVSLNTPDPPSQPGTEWPGRHVSMYAKATVEIAQQMRIDVVDHYAAWMSFEQPAMKEDPNRLAMRMSDAIHPGPVGHLCFYRELAPLFDLPERFCWE